MSLKAEELKAVGEGAVSQLLKNWVGVQHSRAYHWTGNVLDLPSPLILQRQKILKSRPEEDPWHPS